ncbi:MAG: lysophospholipid acyltransferase family protein [Ignavibacteriaceae bacterium]|nr:lysophospholipid acyltransferase family protein [Ignavibacteriaceae bacterium]HRN26911.1 lysophospholipid acyltransferase family protein [Ignavibacteriaceae bacterium]HRP92408.1 lysophospholipid acyltransferase family protein [Ignavibacteriaceae bacterium]HRQ54938.1 lysophospholipid acyltransferase family protein [Ignavibacteriaceae bacterium]
MKNIIEYILFLSLSYLCRLLGLSLSRKFASLISIFFFYLLPIRKDVVFDNLKNAFPELSSNQIKKLAYGTYKNFAITLVEILYLPWTSDEQIKNVVNFKDLDLIDKREKEGNGVILLSGHFGNWEYCAISVGAQLNKKLSVIVKPQRNNFVNDWMNRARTRWTNEVVPLGASIRNVYAVLMKKGIVAMVADQRGPEESIKLEFFGRKTSVYTGPAVLSLKMNVPIIYGITIRQPDFSYRCNVVEISRENLPDNYDEKVKVLSERILRYLEDVIRKNPEQWFWMHKRWKH